MKSVPKSSRLPQSGNVASLASRTRPATKNLNLKPYCGVIKLDCSPQAAGTGTKHPEPKAHIAIMGFDKGWRADSPETFTQLIITDMKNRAPKRISNKDRSSAGYTHINGFIGFRTYYSRILPNIHQRKLSSCLAKTWATYIHKDFWTRYTVLYCAEPRSQCFVDWLIQRVVPPDLPALEELELVDTLLERERGGSKKAAKIPIEVDFEKLQRTEPPDVGKLDIQNLYLDPLYIDLFVSSGIHSFDSPTNVAESFIDESRDPDFAFSHALWSDAYHWR
ncbi:uncharacterized protein V1513DRAFT_437143 [Lipomyces chichibuensis]|uniref:uncharacterized protein n=1 Tax=Lipomyces chichibuensis TaxID=1546026 RepID=UPI003343DED5